MAPILHATSRPAGETIEVAVMVQTEDTLGNTEVARKFPFFGSGITDYASQAAPADSDPAPPLTHPAPSPATAPPLRPRPCPDCAGLYVRSNPDRRAQPEAAIDPTPGTTQTAPLARPWPYAIPCP